MKHLKAIIIKTIAILLITWLIMSLIANVAVGDAMIAGVIITALIYIAGDLLILRKVGNIAAVVADAGAAFLVLWIYLGAMNYNDIVLWSLVTAAVIGVFEYFFHQWLLRENVVPDERKMEN